MSNFSLDEFRDLVSAVSVPMLVRDYRPFNEAFTGWTADELCEYLQDDRQLYSALDELGDHALSDAWIQLYGDGSNPQPEGELPDTVANMTKTQRYPEFKQSLIRQLCAPFRKVKSLVFEHTVPANGGRDVTVRSHWKAAGSTDDPFAWVVVVDLDVTEMRRTESAAHDAAESRARILATVGHELRNPITALAGMSELLETDWDSFDETTRRELVGTITSQAQDATMILADLLANSAAERSALQVVNQPVDMVDLLTGVDLKDFEIDIAGLPPVLGDPLRIRQIIRNLAQNSRKYGGDQRRIEGRVDGATLVIQVSDDGPGVSPEVLPHLFEPFRGAHISGSTGLGLSISHSLAEAMNGRLVYRSDLPETTFELSLPLAIESFLETVLPS